MKRLTMRRSWLRFGFTLSEDFNGRLLGKLFYYWNLELLFFGFNWFITENKQSVIIIVIIIIIIINTISNLILLIE
jgi:hypothetical protein